MKGIKSFRRTFLLIAALYLACGISLLVWPAQSGLVITLTTVILFAVFGVLLFFEPFAALAMVRFIGAVLVLDGCADLVSVLCLTYWVKKAKRGLEAIYDEARYEAAAIEAEGRIQDESEP